MERVSWDRVLSEKEYRRKWPVTVVSVTMGGMSLDNWDEMSGPEEE